MISMRKMSDNGENYFLSIFTKKTLLLIIILPFMNGSS